MKAKNGTTICTLDDLTFPVELRDNPRNTNSEYSKVVTGRMMRTVPYFSEDEIKAMTSGMTEEQAKELIGSYPTTKKVEQVVDLNYCSPIYELVPNADIFPKVEEIFKQKGIEFKVQYSHTQNARFYGNFTIEDPRFSYKMKGTSDVIKFIWNFQHSYNGLTKYKGVAGFYRLVCTNGLTIPVAEMKEYNLCIEGKHTMTILHSLEEFETILVNVTNNLGAVKKSIVDKYELLGGRWVANPADRVTEVLKASGIIAIDNSKFVTVNDIVRRITEEANGTNGKQNMGYNGRVNDWLIYNGINQYVNDDSRNIVSPEKRRETDSKVLEYMLQYA